MNDVAVIEKEVVDAKKITEYLDAFGLSGKLNQNEKKQFIEVAQAYALNPFKREIYCVPYGEGENRKLSIITGYEVYLKRAERLGKLKGWKSWTEGELKFAEKTKQIKKKDGTYWDKKYRVATGSLKAIVQIKRSDWESIFEHEVYLDEYYQDNEMWGNKPRTMLKKVAIAQAFRLAFPDEMGGMPYTSDELPDEMINVTPKEETKKAEAQETKEPEKKAEPEKTLLEKHKELLNEITNLVKSKAPTGKDIFTADEIKSYSAECKALNKLSTKETVDGFEKVITELKDRIQKRLEPQEVAAEFVDDIPWDEKKDKQKTLEDIF